MRRELTGATVGTLRHIEACFEPHVVLSELDFGQTLEDEYRRKQGL